MLLRGVQVSFWEEYISLTCLFECELKVFVTSYLIQVIVIVVKGKLSTKSDTEVPLNSKGSIAENLLLLRYSFIIDQ